MSVAQCFVYLHAFLIYNPQTSVCTWFNSPCIVWQICAVSPCISLHILLLKVSPLSLLLHVLCKMHSAKSQVVSWHLTLCCTVQTPALGGRPSDLTDWVDRERGVGGTQTQREQEKLLYVVYLVVLQVPSCCHTSSCWCSVASPCSSLSCPLGSSPAWGAWEFGRLAQCLKVWILMDALWNLRSRFTVMCNE